jgi:protein-tyrosine phosphatase
VLVHPERHAQLWEAGSQFQELIDAGVLLQVNLGSYVGHYGRGARDRAVSLLQQGVVTLVATDIHSAAELETSIPDAVRMLTNLVGKDVASVLSSGNPRALLTDQTVIDLRTGGGLLVDTSVLRAGGPLSGILGKSMQGLRTFARGSN